MDNWNRFTNLIIGKSDGYGKTKWTCVGKNTQGWPIMRSEDGRKVTAVGQRFDVGFSHYV